MPHPTPVLVQQSDNCKIILSHSRHWTCLLQEADEEVSHGAVGCEKAIDRFLEHIGVETAGSRGQCSQGTQDVTRLFSRDGFFQLLHMLFDICNDRGGKRQSSIEGKTGLQERVGENRTFSQWDNFKHQDKIKLKLQNPRNPCKNPRLPLDSENVFFEQ